MVEIKKLEKGLLEIKGEIAWADVEPFRAHALEHLGEHLKMDGFRDGHIPANIVEKNVPEMKILEEMASHALSKVYPKIIKENNIDAIGYPQINITKLAKDNPLAFTAVVAVLPEVKLPDYKNIAKEVNKKEAGTPDEKRLEMIEAIIAKTDIVIPDLLIEVEVMKMLKRLRADVEGMGQKYDEYLAKAGKTEDEITKEWRVDAEKRAKLQMIVAEIGKAEKIEAPKEKVEAEVKKVLELYKDADPENARMYIEHVFQNEEVFKFLESQN